MHQKGLFSLWIIVLQFNMAIAEGRHFVETQPDLKQLLTVLLEHTAVKIKAAPFCLGAFSDDQDHTLGQYMAGHLATFADEDNNSLSSHCEQLVNKRWQCTVFFRKFAPEREVVSQYGLRFIVDKQGALVTNSFSCPGN